MGKVFTWKEVVRKRVPQLEDFVLTIDLLRKAFAPEGSIVGAVAFGSAVRGDYDLRSDIDCFVLYDRAQEYEAFEVMQSVTMMANLRRVPLTCVPCDTLVSATRMHHIGSSLRKHLEVSSRIGGLLKGDPLRHIANVRSREEEVEEYLRFKLYGIQEASGAARTFSEERFVSYLKKLLEAPMHVARKVLVHRKLLEGDSKREVFASYVKYMGRELSDHLERLISLDALYTEELREQLRCPHEKGYRMMLQKISSGSEDVISFVRANSMFLVATAR